MTNHCGAIPSNHESRVVWKLWRKGQLTAHLLIWNLHVYAFCIKINVLCTGECVCVHVNINVWCSVCVCNIVWSTLHEFLDKGCCWVANTAWGKYFTQDTPCQHHLLHTLCRLKWYVMLECLCEVGKHETKLNNIATVHMLWQWTCSKQVPWHTQILSWQLGW